MDRATRLKFLSENKKTLDKFNLTFLPQQNWYLISRKVLDFAPDDVPHQSTVLFFEPRSGRYIARYFCRTFQRGQVHGSEALEEVIEATFARYRPCPGYGLPHEDLRLFAFMCAKVSETGASCVSCAQAAHSAQMTPLDLRPGIVLEEVKEEGLVSSARAKVGVTIKIQPSEVDDYHDDDDYLRDLDHPAARGGFTTPSNDLFNQSSLMKTEMNVSVNIHNCVFCAKIYLSKVSYGKHLLSVHNQCEGVLSTWLKLKLKKSKQTLQSIRNGTSKYQIDWDSQKTKQLESLVSNSVPDVKKVRQRPGPKPGPPVYHNLMQEPTVSRKADEDEDGLPSQPPPIPTLPRIGPNGEKQYVCDACGKISPSSTMLKRHKRYEHAGSIQFCQICRAKFEYPLPYASHLVTHAPEGKDTLEAKCPICSEMIEFPVSDPKAFESHALECALDDRRNNTQKWKARYPITPCEKCGREFKNELTKKRHMVTDHGETPPYVCDECPYWAVYPTGIRLHKQKHLRKRGVETDEMNHSLYTTCHLCGKKFSGSENSESFKRHLRIHNGEKEEILCPEPGCGKIFNSFVAKRRHVIKIHSTDPKYQCPHCDHRDQIAELKSHVERVHGEAKFKCDECGKMLKSEGSLKSHKYIHTGENPFSCPFCDFVAKSTATISLHKRHVHNHGLILKDNPIDAEKFTNNDVPKLTYIRGQKLPLSDLGYDQQQQQSQQQQHAGLQHQQQHHPHLPQH